MEITLYAFACFPFKNRIPEAILNEEDPIKINRKKIIPIELS